MNMNSCCCHQISFSLLLICSLFLVDSCHGAPAPAPTSLLEVIFSGSAVPEARHLIYSRTPISWILKARSFGRYARQNLTNALETEGQTGAERLSLYAQYLSKCSLIDIQFMGSDTLLETNANDDENANVNENDEQTNQSANDQNDDHQMDSVAANFAFALGLDSMTANLFALPMAARREKIGSTCARNELRLQCALGFYRNRMDKLREHIDMIKDQDGVFKVMLESECQLAATQLEESSEEVDDSDEGQQQHLNSIFQCIHEKSTTLAENCAASYSAYNSSRKQLDQRIQEQFEGAINVLERRLERAGQQTAAGGEQNGNEVEMEKALSSGKTLLTRTLNQLAKIEASKCRRFREMLQCMNTNVQQICGQHPAMELKTMLTVGYLQRERGDILHSQFAELSVETSEDCLAAIGSY